MADNNNKQQQQLPQHETKSQIEWITVTELGYDTTTSSTTDDLTSTTYSISNDNSTSCNDNGGDDGNGSIPCCFHCGNSSKKLSKCAKCHVAAYCSRECQVADWKSGGHKYSCAAYLRVGPSLTLTTPSSQLAARNDLWHRIRFYACPYAIHHSSIRGLGRGFLFLQSPLTLAALSLPTPKRPDGRPFEEARGVLLHFLTMGEYDSELCRDDFELACVRDDLKRSVEEYDVEKEVVVLMRMRCGHVAVGRVGLVPDERICRALAGDYFGGGEGDKALQLNLDDL